MRAAGGAIFYYFFRALRALHIMPAVVASRRNGHLLRGRSAPSKCDRLNVEWGSKPMWLRYDDSNPLNLVWRWQQWEMAHPCTTAQRATWPAFSPHRNKDEYEILQRFQAKSDEFYRRKRQSIFSQLTPGNSVHRPIDLEASESDEEDTDVEDMCVEDLAPRRIDF